ncbi:MAG: methionyl-tRNA formyltransferase [Pirellulales bacterium]|nr:methionyl-tRNA formyltransferase [Planctomycetales bacterium]
MSLRIVMMGTGPFAAPAFRALYNTPHEVVLLVTRPRRKASGGRALPDSPLRAIAAEHDTPTFDPENINTPEAIAELTRYDADLFIVADYGQILADDVLDAARLGGINIHGSLLPKYRGAAPINWAIYHGDRETGVAVIQMTRGLDAGPLLAQQSVAIAPNDTAATLEPRLADLGAQLTTDVVDALAAGRAEATPQDMSRVTRAPRLKKSDGAIDWGRTAEQISNQIRAFDPWPKAFTNWLRTDGPPVRLIIGSVEVLAAPDSAPPGTVVEAADDRLVIATGEGVARLSEIQPSGKRMMPASEFLRGYRVNVGDHFGPAG